MLRSPQRQNAVKPRIQYVLTQWKPSFIAFRRAGGGYRVPAGAGGGYRVPAGRISSAGEPDAGG
jgi:hypothetical protein